MVRSERAREPGALHRPQTYLFGSGLFGSGSGLYGGSGLCSSGLCCSGLCCSGLCSKLCSALVLFGIRVSSFPATYLRMFNNKLFAPALLPQPSRRRAAM